MRRAAVFVLLLAGCATGRTAQAPAVEHESFGLPDVRSPLLFPSEVREVTLAWLVEELARLTGQELALSPETLDALVVAKEALELTSPVPAGEVYTFVEGLLVTQGFFLIPVKDGGRPILGVFQPTEDGPSPFDAGTTVLVTREELPELRRHPALVCQLVLNFENIDSRQLQTQLRQLLVAANGFQVVPAGERSLILQGPGARLYNLGHLLLEIDRASAQNAAPAARPRSPQ
ncbi:MAG: hypothetical protein EXS08_07055 [Planctomycetes bacterium]|nr:hypothetical protein [Planctomycetota bacterium]